MSGDQYFRNIFVKGVAGNTTVFNEIKTTCTVDEFMQIAAKKMYDEMDPADLMLIFGTKQLQYNAGKTLADYNIGHESTLHAVMRLLGGINPFSLAKAQKSGLTSLPGYIKVTSSPKEPCMISLDDDATTRRAKMPCGHVINGRNFWIIGMW